MPTLPPARPPSIFSLLRQRWRELATFAAAFRLLESLFFAPLAAFVGKCLVDRTVLDSTAVLSFLLSPRGLLALALAAILLVALRLLEHAGLSAILFAAADQRRPTARQALQLVLRHLLALLRVSARFVGVVSLTVLPLLLVVAGFATRLLPKHDVNYYLKLRPPEFMVAAAVIGAVAMVTAVAVLWLVVRWRWVVQAVLFTGHTPGAAFTESAALTHGRRGQLAGALIGVTLFSLLLGLLASVVGDACVSIVLGLMGSGTASLAVSFGILLPMRMVLGACCTFVGSCVGAGVFTTLYRRRTVELGRATPVLGAEKLGPVQTARWLPVALVTGLIASASVSTWLILEALADERPLRIHAHRGVWTSAPENTLGAVRAAIAAGADFLETDVQMAKDGELVIAHDSDFSRLGGVAKKVWDLTYEEIRAIPLPVPGVPGSEPEFTPTLDALLAETRGRIKVNLELKYHGDHQPDLARRVVEAVRAQDMLEEVVIQCLEYEPLLEVRRLAPEVPVGYLLSFNAREPARLPVEFLSVEQRRLDLGFILGARKQGRQVYAWTVNTAEEMNRMFDLGVDGVITDQSALARKTVDEYLRLSPAERGARRVRVWLSE